VALGTAPEMLSGVTCHRNTRRHQQIGVSSGPRSFVHHIGSREFISVTIPVERFDRLDFGNPPLPGLSDYFRLDHRHDASSNGLRRGGPDRLVFDGLVENVQVTAGARQLL
jgi:hypothetical protein